MVVHEERIGERRAERERCFANCSLYRWYCASAGFELLVADDRRVEHDEHRCRRRTAPVRLAVVADVVVGGSLQSCPANERARIDHPPPALPAAIAGLVVAADENPRRRGQQRCRRREEVGLPARPRKSVRTSLRNRRCPADTPIRGNVGRRRGSRDRAPAPPRWPRRSRTATAGRRCTPGIGRGSRTPSSGSRCRRSAGCGAAARREPATTARRSWRGGRRRGERRRRR